MAASLALTFKSASAAAMKSDDIEMRIVKGGGAQDTAALDDDADSVSALARIPAARSVYMHSFLRLMVMPGIMLAILDASIRFGVIPKEERLIQLIIAVEAAGESEECKTRVVAREERSKEALRIHRRHGHLPPMTSEVRHITFPLLTPRFARRCCCCCRCRCRFRCHYRSS